MGYNLAIGNGYLAYDKEDNYLRVEVKSERLDNAPAYGEPTDYTNQRWPSYTAWSKFMEHVGLYDILWNKESELCLIPSHPGYAPISNEHKEAIDKAWVDFHNKYPNVEAGFAKDGEEENWPEENGFAVRLEWLKFWVDWSLENCEIPTFYNS